MKICTSMRLLICRILSKTPSFARHRKAGSVHRCSQLRIPNRTKRTDQHRSKGSSNIVIVLNFIEGYDFYG